MIETYEHLEETPENLKKILDSCIAIGERLAKVFDGQSDDYSTRITDEIRSGGGFYPADGKAERLVTEELGKNENLLVISEDGERAELGGDEPYLLLSDPIDGSMSFIRKTVMGAASSHAVLTNKANPTFGDVVAGVLVLFSEKNRIFCFDRQLGKVWERTEEGDMEVSGLAEIENIQELFPVGREPLFLDIQSTPFASDRFFTSDVKIHAHNGSASQIMQVALGKVAGFADIRDDIWKSFPDFRPFWKGKGKAARLMPHDCIAAVSILEILGGKVTNLQGSSLQEIPLFDDNGRNLPLSIVAGRDRNSHEFILKNLCLGLELIREDRQDILKEVKARRTRFEQIFHN